MAHRNPSFSSLLLLLPTTTSTAASFYFPSMSSYKTAISLSHILLIRVSNLRASRGDIVGANRAKTLSRKLESLSGLGCWRMTLLYFWDYSKKYAWKGFDYREMYGVVSELNELARLLAELTRKKSDAERVVCVRQNYDNVLRVSKSVLLKFLKVFNKTGMLKETMEAVKREVVDGGLLRDCLELGINDLEGLIQIIRDLASQFNPNSRL